MQLEEHSYAFFLVCTGIFVMMCGFFFGFYKRSISDSRSSISSYCLYLYLFISISISTNIRFVRSSMSSVYSGLVLISRQGTHKFLQISSWSAKVLQVTVYRTNIMQYHDNLTRHIVFLQMHFFYIR